MVDLDVCNYGADGQIIARAPWRGFPEDDPLFSFEFGASLAHSYLDAAATVREIDPDGASPGGTGGGAAAGAAAAPELAKLDNDGSQDWLVASRGGLITPGEKFDVAGPPGYRLGNFCQ